MNIIFKNFNKALTDLSKIEIKKFVSELKRENRELLEENLLLIKKLNKLGYELFKEDNKKTKIKKIQNKRGNYEKN